MLIWSRPGDLGQTSPVVLIITCIIISQIFLPPGFQREPNLTLAFFPFISPSFHQVQPNLRALKTLFNFSYAIFALLASPDFCSPQTLAFHHFPELLSIYSWV